MKIILLLFVALFFSCSQPQKPKLIIQEQWRDDIFTKFVNPIIDKYAMRQLRETALSVGDLEVRVWFSSFEIDGFILKRIDSNWSAVAVKEIDCNKTGYYPKDKVYKLGKIELAAPKSGWENTWQELNNAGMLDLPYSFYIPGIDEGSYKLETNIDGVYWIRFYGSGDKSQEAEQMRKIGEIIADEFGLYNFKVGSLCLER